MATGTKDLLAQYIFFSTKAFYLLIWLFSICQELERFDKSAETNNTIQPLKAPWIIRKVM